MSEWMIYLAFAVVVLLPLLPGLRELLSRHDDEALHIDMGYTRDPRYLGKAMREKARPIIERHAPGTHLRYLHRRLEYARVVDKLDLPNKAEIGEVLLSQGPLSAGQHSKLLDVYAQGEVSVGGESSVRAIAADGDTRLGESVSVSRWIDSAQNLTVGRGSNLGQSAAASGILALAGGVAFRRLFGNPVVIGERVQPRPVESSFGASLIGVGKGTRELSRGGRKIAPFQTVKADIIAHGDVEIGNNSLVEGSIKTSGSVIVGADARVTGNIVARRNVTIAARGTVLGHVFAEQDVQVGPSVTLGSPWAPKTLQASGSMNIARGATMYGWVISERGGTTEEERSLA